MKAGNLPPKKAVSPLSEIGVRWIEKYFHFFRLARVRILLVEHWKYGPLRPILCVTVYNSSQDVHTRSGAHPVSYSVGTESSFPKGKADGA